MSPSTLAWPPPPALDTPIRLAIGATLNGGTEPDAAFIFLGAALGVVVDSHPGGGGGGGGKVEEGGG